MRTFLRGGPEHEIVLLTGRDTRQPEEAPLHFGTEVSAVDFLSHFHGDRHAMAKLRRVLDEDRPHGDVSGLADHAVVRQLAWQLVSGRVHAVRAFARYGIALGGDAAQAGAQPRPQDQKQAKEREYELCIQVHCEVTGHTLPVVPYVVFDNDGDEIAHGITDREGYARVPPVRDPGTFRIVVFRERVDEVWLVLLGEDGQPVPETAVELTDSAGAKLDLASDRDGVVRGPRAASGRATLKIEVGGSKKVVPVYLDPHARHARTVKVPGWFSPAGSPPELALPG